MIIAKSDLLSLYCIAESAQGGRPENQDDLGFLDTPLGFLCIVCDGMGGGPGGKTASYIVKYEISTAIASCSSLMSRQDAFKMAVAKAQEALESKIQEVPSLNGMGSTFVAVLINKDSAIVAHAGDSRCYLMRGRHCVYRSKDHSLVAELVKKKALTEEEARLSPQSNVISRGLGATSNHVPEIDEVFFCKGDNFVLCTDGVWGSMPHKDLMIRFSQSPDIQTVVKNLSLEIDKIGFAKGGGHDNHTISIIAMGEGSTAKSFAGKIRQYWIFFRTALFLLLLLSVGFGLYLVFHHDRQSEPVFAMEQLPTTQKDISKESVDNSTSRVLIEAKRKEEELDQIESGNTEDNKIDKECKDNNQKNMLILPPAELIDLAISKYEDAKNISVNDVKKAQDSVYCIRDEILEIISILHESIDQIIDAKAKLDAIERLCRKDENWFVAGEPSGNKHVLTNKARKKIDKQIEHFIILKQMI